MRIFVLEDDEAIGIGLSYTLESEKYEVTLVKTVAEAKKTVENEEFDLYILDLTLPDGNGYEVCSLIKSKGDLPVIFLTAYDDEINVVTGFELGADDYISKPFGVMELRARINAHLRREHREHSVRMVLGRVCIQMSQKKLLMDDKELPFTKAEYEICEFLAKNRGQVFSKEQILEAVFGFDNESNDSTIITHIKNIRAKFADYDYTPIKTVWGIGYKWEE